MKVVILSASVLLMVATGAQAADNGLTISGFVDANIERISNGATTKVRQSSGGLNTSRVIFSGNEDLGGGVHAIFTHEMKFAVDTGAGPSPRVSYVGLTSGLGELTLGRQNTPSFWIGGFPDPTFSADYSMVSNMQFFYAAFRVDNSVSYITPSINGFKGRFMVTAGAEDGTRNGRYTSVGIEYRNGPLYAGAASDLMYTKQLPVTGKGTSSSRDNYFSILYSVGGFEPSIIYHTYNGYYAYPPFVDFQSKGWDVQLGARYQINGNSRMYVSYVHKHDDNNVKLSNANGFVVGYVYDFSKRTSLYGTYARIQHAKDTPIRYPVTFSDNVAPNGNPSGVQIGIRHRF